MVDKDKQVSSGKTITLMWQGRVDGTVEGFEVNGMLTIPDREGVTYVTREQAAEFFGFSIEASKQEAQGGREWCQACGGEATRELPPEATDFPGPYCDGCGTDPAPQPRERGHMGSTPDGGIDDHDEPGHPPSLVRAVDDWFAQNTGLGGCSNKDVRELADLFYGVTYEGGRESVEDALAVVESFGPGIQGLNDAFARQVILAAEVKRGRDLYAAAVMGRHQMREALRTARDHIEMDSLRVSHCKDADAIESALAATPATPAQAERVVLTDEQINTLRSRHGVTSNGRGIKEFTNIVSFVRDVEAHGSGTQTLEVTPEAVALWLEANGYAEMSLSIKRLHGVAA